MLEDARAIHRLKSGAHRPAEESYDLAREVPNQGKQFHPGNIAKVVFFWVGLLILDFSSIAGFLFFLTPPESEAELTHKTSPKDEALWLTIRVRPTSLASVCPSAKSNCGADPSPKTNILFFGEAEAFCWNLVCFVFNVHIRHSAQHVEAD